MHQKHRDESKGIGRTLAIKNCLSQLYFRNMKKIKIKVCAPIISAALHSI